jgi:hypothetical protein
VALNETVSKVLSAQTILKLPLAAINNIFEFTQPAVRNGALNTFIGALKAFTRSGKIQAKSAGAGLEALKRSRITLTGGTQNAAKVFLELNGFQTSQKWIDSVATLSGIQKGKQLLKMVQKNPNNFVAREMLTRLAGEENIAGVLSGKIKGTDLDRVFGVKTLSDIRPINRLDLPFFWHSNTGRLGSQFKSFAFKFGQTLHEEIINSVSKGQGLKKLMTFIAVANMSGEGMNFTKDSIRRLLGKEPRRESLPEFLSSGRKFGEVMTRVMENMMSVGGLGLTTDFISAMQFGDFPGNSYLATLLGPTASDVERTLSAGTKIIPKIGKEILTGRGLKTKDVTSTIKQLLGAAPFFRDILRATGVFGK